MPTCSAQQKRRASDDVEVRYLNADALIALKIDSQRDQDRNDVSALQSLKDTNSP